MGTTSSTGTLTNILAPVSDWINRGNKRLNDIALQENDTVLGAILNFAIDASGKRVRPAIVFLAHELFHQADNRAVDLAAATECLHSATLVHDDIVDEAESRRGRDTVHMSWSTGVAVLAGDYLFASAASLVGGLNDPRIMTLFADTIMRISRSEFDDPTHGPDAEQLMADYLAKIEGKTASLFGLCCEAAAVLAGGTKDQQRDLREYGLSLGNAFQIADDILDVIGDPDVTGKAVGGDLEGGLLTAPTIHFLQMPGSANSVVAQFLNESDPNTEELDTALMELKQSGAIDQARSNAARFGNEAREHLTSFPDGPYTRALEALTYYVVNRTR